MAGGPASQQGLFRVNPFQTYAAPGKVPPDDSLIKMMIGLLSSCTQAGS